MNWSYINYWNCRYYEILYILFCTVLLGAFAGILKAYNYFEAKIEQKLNQTIYQTKKLQFVSIKDKKKMKECNYVISKL